MGKHEHGHDRVDAKRFRRRCLLVVAGCSVLVCGLFALIVWVMPLPGLIRLVSTAVMAACSLGAMVACAWQCRDA